jgi:ribosomal protein L16/L10AE
MGLLGLAREAAEKAARKVPIKYEVISVQGEVIQQEWA